MSYIIPYSPTENKNKDKQRIKHIKKIKIIKGNRKIKKYIKKKNK